MDYQLDLQQANGFDLLDWFSSGAQEVAAHKKYLNDINVFPVADGDTGTNLATTLRAMVEKPARARSFAGMLQGISKSGLESARGNSGIIFASFINGAPTLAYAGAISGGCHTRKIALAGKGGTLSNEGGSLQNASGHAATLDGSAHGALTLKGIYTVTSNSTTFFVGDLVNNGAFQVNGGNGSNSTVWSSSSGRFILCCGDR